MNDTNRVTKQNGQNESNGSSGKKLRHKSPMRCRHCCFVTISKREHWYHCRLHIKPERLLTCAHCNFVTEYKHHLEYHMRGHKGLKRFKCTECSYVCVNKSMVNSHMKSHSVYPYGLHPFHRITFHRIINIFNKLFNIEFNIIM